jgi:hypothetical protein
VTKILLKVRFSTDFHTHNLFSINICK